MAKGVLLIISGPSGSGKGTIVEQLVSELGYCVSISATTRNPRPNEKDGIHYFFKTKEEFEKTAKKELREKKSQERKMKAEERRAKMKHEFEQLKEKKHNK